MEPGSKRRKRNPLISSEAKRTISGFSKRHRGTLILVAGILLMCVCITVWFATPMFSDPDFDIGVMLSLNSKYKKTVSVNGVISSNKDIKYPEGNNSTTITPGSTHYGGWDNLSGYYWGKYPIELYILSTIGERGCSEAAIHACSGDYGQAYGLMQLDYRHDLVPFMRASYASDPVAWKGLEPFLSLEPRDPSLVNNQGIVDAFNFCYDNYPEKYMEFQPNFMVDMYLFSPIVKKLMEDNGFNIEDHSVFVTAALLSCNINCGDETGTRNFFKAGATNSMSDEELLECVYNGWRMYRTASKWTQHGHRLATDGSGEHGIALQLVRGEIDVTTFDNSKSCNYGAGWDGPNAVRISTKGN